MTTKAVVFNDAHDVSIEEIDDPELESPNDAIRDVTGTAICGSDLHMYEGRADAGPIPASTLRNSARRSPPTAS